MENTFLPFSTRAAVSVNVRERNRLFFPSFEEVIVIPWRRAAHLAFTIFAFCAQINIIFKNIAKIGEVTKVAIIVAQTLLLVYFTFLKVQTALRPILKVPQIFKKKCFFPTIFFCLFHQQVWTIFRYWRLKTCCTRNCTWVYRYNFTFNFFWSTNFGVQNCFER